MTQQNADAVPKGRRGLALPLSRQTGGYFAPKSGRELAWGDLLAAVFTPTGSRPMRRQFGSRLHTFLFEPSLRPGDPIVDYVVRETASRWCPGTVVRGVAYRAAGRVLRVRIDFTSADAAGVATPGGGGTQNMTSPALTGSAL